MKLRYSFCIVALFVGTLAAQTPKSPPATQPDDRFKADVLLIVAHPDDETGVSGYLAQLLDQHKRVAAVYLTHGEAGHNHMGPERATALGAVREMELRHAMTKLGIDNVWFLGWPRHPELRMFCNRWRIGITERRLEEVVRMVRLTRPEVIVTWLPAFFIGENHGDHQAAGVLATEAFDMAGDPSVFPAQLAAPVRVNETLARRSAALATQEDLLLFRCPGARAIQEHWSASIRSLGFRLCASCPIGRSRWRHSNFTSRNTVITSMA